MTTPCVPPNTSETPLGDAPPSAGAVGARPPTGPDCALDRESGPGESDGPQRPTWRSSLRFAGRVLQVRLRFVLVLLAASLCVGQWDRLQRVWEWTVARTVRTRPADETVAADTEYFCPMDPGVLSDWPTVCPVCNMALVRRKKGEAVLLPEGVVARMQISPYRIQLAGIRTTLVRTASGPSAESSETPASSVPASPVLVPETAVVDHGDQQIVFVETMPGMFDAVIVQLGPRAGDWYPVLRGLQAGDRVASVGAYLLDAEARLNPSLAAAYFGAQRNGEKSPLQLDAPRGVRPATRPAKAPVATLSAEDQALAAEQRVCPVTGLPLTSMGGPVLVRLGQRKVFICCSGCEAKLKSSPETYLAKLPGQGGSRSEQDVTGGASKAREAAP